MSDDSVGPADAPPVAAVGRDYQLDDDLAVSDPQRLKALGDPLRLHICDLVLERSMSVSELAELVDRPKGTVAYHVDVLVDAGLLQVVRTRRVRAVEERFYGRTARTFVYSGTGGHVDFLRRVADEYDEELLDRLHIEADPEGVGSAHHEWGGSTLRHARIPHDRVADYVRRLQEIALEFVDEPRGGEVEFGLFFTVYPTNRRKDHPA